MQYVIDPSVVCTVASAHWRRWVGGTAWNALTPPLSPAARSSASRSACAWPALGARASRAGRRRWATGGPPARTSRLRAVPPKCRRAGASTTARASGPPCAWRARSPSQWWTVSYPCLSITTYYTKARTKWQILPGATWGEGRKQPRKRTVCLLLVFLEVYCLPWASVQKLTFAGKFGSWIYIARKSETVVFILLWYLQHSVTSQVDRGHVNRTALLMHRVYPTCKLTKMARGSGHLRRRKKGQSLSGPSGGAGPFLLSTVFPYIRGQLLILLRESLVESSYLMITGILVLLPKGINLFYLLY